MANTKVRPEFTLNWDLQDVEVRSKRVEQQLAPLIDQITTLVNAKERPSQLRKNRSQRGEVLVAAVAEAIKNFIDAGTQISLENPEAAEQLNIVLAHIRETGDIMLKASTEFVADPCSSNRRANLVKAARSLLTSVTKLLCLCDMLDVQIILHALKKAFTDLEAIKQATDQNQLDKAYSNLRKTLDEINKLAMMRAGDLRDPNECDDLLAARAMLKTHCPILYSATKTYLRHPARDEARRVRDYAYDEVHAALMAMHDIIHGRMPQQGVLMTSPSQLGMLMQDIDRFVDYVDRGCESTVPYGGIGMKCNISLCQLLKLMAESEFPVAKCYLNAVYLDPQSYRDDRNRPDLEGQLENIVSGAAAVADSGHTREDRRQRIVGECNHLRHALQELLDEYQRNCGRKEPSEELDLALVRLGHKSRDLKRHLRRAVVDHVSDAFLDTRVPLLLLIEAAKAGDEEGVEMAGHIFEEHARKLIEVSQLVCAISTDEEGIKMVQYAAAQISRLYPQVVNAARLLASEPNSKPAQSNMDAFKEAWEEKVRLLTLAVDSVITVDDFLAVSEAHVLEDVKACIQAVIQRDSDTLDRTAGAIRGRSLRVCEVVDGDMQLHPADAYTDRVRQATRVLREDVLRQFALKAEQAVHKLMPDIDEDVELEEFVDASGQVHEAIRDIRHALLMNRDPGDIDSDEDYEEAPTESIDQSMAAHKMSQQQQNEEEQTDNQRAIMRQLPEEDKKKIQEQIDVFKVVQNKFEREVAKWDDAGNDIIVLAKYMCMIMMEMTDFTRGRGPLKSTMDVIAAARKISEAGSKLNALSQQIADECVESETKKDLVAYMQRIVLHCHQLNITSKVKADIQQVGDEVIVSGLESAMSLIQTARNLLNAVVLTVKSAYIASTMYPAKNGRAHQLVVWKMRAPEKKALYRADQSPDDGPPARDTGTDRKNRGIIRRASHRREMPPIKALAEFNAA